MPTVPQIDVTPLYALAGAGEVAITALRKRTADLQEQASSLRVRALTAAEELAGKAVASYGEFAHRGEQIVAGLRGDSVSSAAGSAPARQARAESAS